MIIDTNWDANIRVANAVALSEETVATAPCLTVYDWVAWESNLKILAGQLRIAEAKEKTLIYMKHGCGAEYEYETLADVPREAVRCSCGEWLIKDESDVKQENRNRIVRG